MAVNGTISCGILDFYKYTFLFQDPGEISCHRKCVVVLTKGLYVLQFCFSLFCFTLYGFDEKIVICVKGYVFKKVNS